MPYFYKNKKDSPGSYEMSSIGTDIKLNLGSQSSGVEVCSSIGEDWENPNQTAIAHGVLLTMTALAAEGMHEVLDNPKFEHCIKCALDRVPDLSRMLDSEQ